MILKGSKYCIYSGDANQDTVIDLSEKDLATGYLNIDLRGDGIVDLSDLNIAYN